MINTTLYPIIKSEETGKDCVYRKVSSVNHLFPDNIPYIADVNVSMDKAKSENTDKVLIVSSSLNVALKSAKYLCEAWRKKPEPVKDEPEDPIWELEFDLDDEDAIEYEIDLDEDGNTMDYKAIDHIDMSVIKTPEILPGNAYLNTIIEESKGDYAFYDGFNKGEDIKNKVDAMLVDEREKKFLWIIPERLNESWVVDLQVKKGFVPVIIKDIPDQYYEDIFDRIMESANMKLEKGLITSTVVNHIRKKCGAGFSEEDLDWMIEHAMRNRACPNKNILTMRDFSLNGAKIENSEDKLMNMPGLKNVKDMVKEFTALILENGRKKSLGDMHTSMIFYGNPGTGKTTCAQLLAGIMADKGVSNSSFTMASRADIIGKYVGHTAAKVAALFEKARGGILFVDEAGFFLNEGSGGFLQEAVKEFVRFMELYPDVT
nr:AAA family ATPase [Lachnospiraceae bacterium]